MNAPCGLEDCDCGHTIERLETFVSHKPECAVKKFVMSQPPPARHWRCDCGLRAALEAKP